ncbi:MAG: carboxypeptidase regulatory-like domain-containing protein [Planctomycetes bacterium]|nr:carboxypeptidase regulatory-like domain-containing protein [Planctomycetota bacterium]
MMALRSLTLPILAVALLLLAWFLWEPTDPPGEDATLQGPRRETVDERPTAREPREGDVRVPVERSAREPEPTHTIHGRVLGPLGDPIENARVWVVRWPACDTHLATMHSDANGQFTFEGIAPDGTKWVYAEAEGMTRGREVARIRTGTTETGVTLRLWDACVVFGRVTDEGGQPIAGAQVVGTNDYSWLDGSFHPPEDVTNTEGEYRLEGLPVGRFAIRAHARGFTMGERYGFQVGEARVDLVLAKTGGMRIEVELLDLPADLASRTTLQAYPTRRGSGFALPSAFDHLPFDASGKLVVEGLLRAEWNLQMPELPGWIFEPRSHCLSPDQDEHHVQYHAFRIGSLTLHGTLHDEAGHPLAGESLVCFTQRSQSMYGGPPGRVRTNAHGAFELQAPLAPDEPFSLVLVGSEYVLQQTKTKEHTGFHDPRFRIRYEGVARPDEALALVASRAAYVSGKLVNTDGDPIPYQWMDLELTESIGFPMLSYTTSRLDGSFAFPGVHGGDSPLRIVVDGKYGAGQTELTLAKGARRTDVLVTLAKTGIVRGTVHDVAGTPTAGLIVEIDGTSEGDWTSVITDRFGRYCFPNAAPGSRRILMLEKKNGAAHLLDGRLVVEPGAEIQHDLTWPAPFPSKDE